MKILFLLLLPIFCFAQKQFTLNPNDARLTAYKDSMDCYLFGIWQEAYAKNIPDRNDTAQGMKYYNLVVKKNEKLNQNIKPVSYMKELCIWWAERKTGKTGWRPDIYKKPVMPTIFMLATPIKTKSSLIKIVQSKLYVIKPETPDKINLKAVESVIMPDGSKITRAEFIKRYKSSSYTKIAYK